MDVELRQRQINDFVLLFTSSLSEIRNNDPSTGKKNKSGKLEFITILRNILYTDNENRSELYFCPGPMNNVAAFTVTSNKVSASWSDAKESIGMIANEDCKQRSIQAMGEAAYYIEYYTLNSLYLFI